MDCCAFVNMQPVREQVADRSLQLDSRLETENCREAVTRRRLEIDRYCQGATMVAGYWVCSLAVSSNLGERASTGRFARSFRPANPELRQE